MTILMIVAVTTSSCDKVAELTTVKVPVGKLTFNFDAIIDNDARSAVILRAAEIHKFSGKDTLVLNSENLNSYAGYLNLVKSVTVNAIDIKITSESGGTFVQKMELKSNYLNSSWTLPEYRFGNSYKGDEALCTLFSKALMAVFENKKVDVELSGETDGPAGGKITITVALEGYLTAQLVK
ncbi:hypothetical protein FACS1894182_04950 [Bacteroidia bacterium]|nr:hypothetical protein FACS1894182_04950 [Bacteroidia bacterium]